MSAPAGIDGVSAVFMPACNAAPEEPAKKLAVIDAARGWAILLVIVSHVGGLFPELPWPVKKLTNFGWFGVQLFFVVSAYTLLASWYRDQRPLGDKTSDFFARRFFRIAPMYYAAVLIYLFLRPPGGQFSWELLATTMLFVNAWTPQWLAVEPGSWTVVPGGWSVSVEFTFYVLFPLFAFVVSSLQRALCAVVACALLAAVSHQAGQAAFAGIVSERALAAFLFFWIPSQLVVFAIGAVLFHAVAQATRQCRRPLPWLVGGAIALLLIAQFHFGKFWFVDGALPPAYFLASALFAAMVFVLLRSDRPPRPLVNPFLCSLGEASFSAYLLHWMFLDLAHAFPSALRLDASGPLAIGMFAVLLPLIVLATWGVARLAHVYIEKPFIRIGRVVGRSVSARGA